MIRARLGMVSMMAYAPVKSQRVHVLALHLSISYVFFFIDPATTEIYTLSLHDALPISWSASPSCSPRHSSRRSSPSWGATRSEEHTSELQSLRHLVCRLLLEKKKETKMPRNNAVGFTTLAPKPKRVMTALYPVDAPSHT